MQTDMVHKGLPGSRGILGNNPGPGGEMWEMERGM